jgi:hypothetical protein
VVAGKPPDVADLFLTEFAAVTAAARMLGCAPLTPVT